MTVDKLARHLGQAPHGGSAIGGAQQLGNRRRKARISNQIGRLNQQVKTLQARLDRLNEEGNNAYEWFSIFTGISDVWQRESEGNPIYCSLCRCAAGI